MNTRTTNECGPQKLHKVEGERPGNVNNPAQCGRREAGAERLWPRKPVIHRRRSDPRTQGSIDMLDFENMTISKQTEGILSPREDNSETRKIHGLNHPSKDLLEPQRDEVEMGRLIHAKKLMLLQTLLNLEEKVRQKLQSVEASAGDDRKYKAERHNRAAWPHTRLCEQRRGQSVKPRGDRMEEERREGGRHLRGKQHPRDEHRTRDTHDEQRDTWRLAGVRPEHGREVNDASTGSKYRGKEMYEQETPPMAPHKPAASHAAENRRGAAGKACEGSSLPPISRPSSSSRSQQHEVGPVHSAGTSFHLLPCRFCNRKFMSGRLEKHVQICAKVKQSRRRVFNSYINRTKGSAIEEFCKTHSRSKTPEV